jgi:hypothetical protein
MNTMKQIAMVFNSFSHKNNITFILEGWLRTCPTALVKPVESQDLSARIKVYQSLTDSNFKVNGGELRL